MFTTPLGKSYLCPSPPAINLYESKQDKPSVKVRFTNVHFQAFQIEFGKFSPSKYRKQFQLLKIANCFCISFALQSGQFWCWRLITTVRQPGARRQCACCRWNAHRHRFHSGHCRLRCLQIMGLQASRLRQHDLVEKIKAKKLNNNETN